MNYYLKKSILVVSTFVFSLVSCNSKNNSFVSTTNIKKEISFKRAVIVININNRLTFNIQSTNSIPAVSFSDIKSFTAFLTTNPIDPFFIGSNPLGDRVIFYTNNIEYNAIKIFNVPAGGAYYAVVTAFDALNGNGNNLAEANKNINSFDNKWYVSSDSVIVNSSGETFFSNKNNSLNVNLELRKPIPNNITSDITIINGGDNEEPINVN